MIKFYYHFAAAYGTIWFFLLLAALLTQSRINTGEFGLIGFPIISLLYAIYAYRYVEIGSKQPPTEINHEKKLKELEDKVAQLQAEVIMKNP